MNPSIAIVGMACIYPDASTPVELWENVLAQRRAFRRLPPERVRHDDYWSADPDAPDRTYSFDAAVIEGYEFDRVAFRVVGSTFRSADLAHWLALDVAARSLSDAGFKHGEGLPREMTGVLLGNSLNGEFARANLMRLRWPYVRRVLEAALIRRGHSGNERKQFLAELEAEYKSPFPPVGEETLAGGLSNTIAGRICNHFNLKGGGYTVDGACASSLLAVTNACSSLVEGDLDVALAGGVDLSLDPFELVGFAKTAALATGEMLVFDEHSSGFWPGEGCGFVTLMRLEDALAQGRRIYSVIRGWGISSDGQGGITRPEREGQLEALRRAYRRAGFGADTVAYCEAHGTGTSVGDATELEVLSRVRREANPDASPAAIGSIKANIGHTKAAAGIAGLIKASMAVHTQVLPATTGCRNPHPLLQSPDSPLRILREPELWPADRPLRASVSAMGFGGINAHVVLEGNIAARRNVFSHRERSLAGSLQDVELFVLGARTMEELVQKVNKLQSVAAGLSLSEMPDLAARLQRDVESTSIRAAIVASRPSELAGHLASLRVCIDNGETSRLDFADGVFLGSTTTPPRIGFLFPGQGSPTRLDGGIWGRRFQQVRELYHLAALPADGDRVSTRLMQPAIATASLAGLKVLNAVDLTATIATGHSLGEFAALHWAGAMDEQTLLRLVRARGEAMANLGGPTGAMAAIAASWQEVRSLLNGDPLTVVGYNSPHQTVVAGEVPAIEALLERADDWRLKVTRLPVSHAFHTPLVAAALPVLAEELARARFASLKLKVVSTVTGDPLERDADLRDLLCRQVTSPVRFSRALENLLGEGREAGAGMKSNGSPEGIDLLVEVGPGSVLSSLVQETTEVPVVSLDAGGDSLRGLLLAVGAAFALGADPRLAALFEDRVTRAFAPDRKPKFFANPCEQAPLPDGGDTGVLPGETDATTNGNRSVPSPSTDNLIPADNSPSPVELIRQLVARRAELPVSAVLDHHRMLSDLHLNSITVGQLVSEAARQLGLPRLVGVTEFANASVTETATALEQLKLTGTSAPARDLLKHPPGVDSWVEAFAVELVRADPPTPFKAPARPRPGAEDDGDWRFFAPEHHVLTTELSQKLRQAGGGGVVLCLPEISSETHIGLMLDAARAIAKVKTDPRFVLVQHGSGGAGFARTLHLETPGLTTCVVNVPANHPRAADWIVSEVLAASGYCEAHYDAEGRRRCPRLQWLPPERENSLPHEPLRGARTAISARTSSEKILDMAVRAPAQQTRKGHNSDLPLSKDDVLLVTGGGKGISAECALELARATGTALILLGRSDPETDSQLRQNLERIKAAGVRCCYVRADLTDAQAVRTAVSAARKQFGPVTALLHGAGTNTPQLIATLDEAAFQNTVAPKIQGVRNVMAAIDPDKLRLFVSFGSIIARAGFRGEADYATANEWLTALTEDFQSRHPGCRCLALEWSVWSGVGMGERLGRVESLVAQGISPISTDAGVRMFLRLLRHPPKQVAVVVSGRIGKPPTLKLDQPALPLRRFLERKRVFYPGVELVVDAELSVDSDPYLNDHVLQQQRLFPAVLGLEAMAQVAMALAGSSTPPDFEQVRFSRPVAVSDKAGTTIRLAALRRSPDTVEVCLRSDETDFQVDHFHALCRFTRSAEDRAPADSSTPGPNSTMGEARACRPGFPHSRERLPLLPEKDIYGPILFHQGRFRRLDGYRLLSARECVAEITPDSGANWFGHYLPAGFTLGDPAGRDAALHAIQACIPHRRILPTGIDSIEIHRCETGLRLVSARERQRDGDNFVYDVEVTTPAGEIVECWAGLRLRAVELIAPPNESGWPEALLAPYLERRIEELAGDAKVNISVEHSREPKREARSKRTLQRALADGGQVWHRPDGKPVRLDGTSVSTAHTHDLTLAVTRCGEVSCDLETVNERNDETWRQLLGEDRFQMAKRISREQSESYDQSATRLWGAMECIKKAGLAAQSPLVLDLTTPDGWTLLRSGSLTIATMVTSVRSMAGPMAVAIALEMQSSSQAPGAVAAEA